MTKGGNEAMRTFNKFMRIGLVVCLGICIGLPYCNGVSAQDKRSDPIELTFSVVPEELGAMSAVMYEPFIKYIAQKTGKKVAFYMTTSYAAEVEAMISGFVDIASFGPAAYVLAVRRDPNIEVFAVKNTKPGVIRKGGPGFNGCLITKKGGKYDTIEILRGATLALTDPASTSGYFLPKVLFTEEKLKGEPLEKYFGKIVWTGQHDAAMLAVQEGRADAAFTNDGNMESAIAAGLVKKEWYNYLWWSKTVPTDPWAFRKNLKPEIKEKIKEAFYTFKPGQVEGADKFWASYIGIEFLPQTDATYDVIRKLVDAKEKMDKEKPKK